VARPARAAVRRCAVSSRRGSRTPVVVAAPVLVDAVLHSWSGVAVTCHRPALTASARVVIDTGPLPGVIPSTRSTWSKWSPGCAGSAEPTRVPTKRISTEKGGPPRPESSQYVAATACVRVAASAAIPAAQPPASGVSCGSAGVVAVRVTWAGVLAVGCDVVPGGAAMPSFRHGASRSVDWPRAAGVFAGAVGPGLGGPVLGEFLARLVTHGHVLRAPRTLYYYLCT
jgi:hypothetical protein